MEPSGPRAFLNALACDVRAALLAQARQARQSPPSDWLQWHCGMQPMGWLSPQCAQWLQRNVGGLVRADAALVWQAEHWPALQRSECLQQALRQAHAAALLTGWRDERFSYWHADCAQPDPARPSLLDVERAGFRFLGMLSHAVHVNAFLPDGRLWVARRSAHKATDPGMLDNMTAGGLPSGETLLQCLGRELAEEAGVLDLQAHAWEAVGHVRCSWVEPQGWHDEFLHVVNLALGHAFVPHNQDGEVQEFLCLTPMEVAQHIAQHAFTPDAVQSLVRGLAQYADESTKPSGRSP